MQALYAESREQVRDLPGFSRGVFNTLKHWVGFHKRLPNHKFNFSHGQVRLSRRCLATGRTGGRVRSGIGLGKPCLGIDLDAAHPDLEVKVWARHPPGPADLAD